MGKVGGGLVRGRTVPGGRRGRSKLGVVAGGGGDGVVENDVFVDGVLVVGVSVVGGELLAGAGGAG
jgi:hypothetical protein